MNMKLTFKGIEIEAEYTISPGEPEISTLSNGDPGTPGTGDEVEIHALWYTDGAGDVVSVLPIAAEWGHIEEIEELIKIRHHEENH